MARYLITRNMFTHTNYASSFFKNNQTITISHITTFTYEITMKERI